MTIILKNKGTLLFDDFIFRCVVGKNGLTKNKIEGDKKTPKGFFEIGELFFRKDRCKKPMTKIKTLSIKRNMGWCNDTKSSKYNKLIKIPQKLNYEKLFRNDEKYNFIIPIEYNTKKPTKNKGSAIFLHLTKNYKPTAGCIAIKKNDFLVLLKLINKKTKIKII